MDLESISGVYPLFFNYIFKNTTKNLEDEAVEGSCDSINIVGNLSAVDLN